MYGDTPPQRGKGLLTFSWSIEKNNLFHVSSPEVADDSSFRPRFDIFTGGGSLYPRRSISN